MASASKGRRAEETRLKAQAEAAAARAAEAAKAVERVDPLEERRRSYVTGWDDWRTGKNGPVDVRAMPDQLGMALYRDAKQARDAGRIGRGYGLLGDGANANLSTALDKEGELERSLAASGMLEDYVTNQDAAVTQELYGLTDRSSDRSRYLAELARAGEGDAYARYDKFRSSKRPSFLKQLALGAIGNVSYKAGSLAV